MITVDEVFPVDIRASVGPAGTVKRLFLNLEYFRNRGYEMTIFANHFTHSRGLVNYYELREMTEVPPINNYSSVKGSGHKKQVVSKIKKWIEGSWLGSYYFLKYKLEAERNRTIQGYIDKGRRPDIIVFHAFAECNYYLKHRQDSDHAKVVVFLHSDGRDISMMYNNFPKLVGSRLMKQLYQNYLDAINGADRVVYISKLAVEAFLELHPDYNRKKIFTAVNGIDNKEMIKSAPSCNFKYRICTSGTVNKRKGQYLIIEAMKKMRPEVLKDTHLSIFGLGPDFDLLVEDVFKSTLNDHVTFYGNVPNPDMHAKLSAENIYCLMSNNEGLPIAILEAMRAGLPVISTKVAGIPEQVDERNGILIEPDVEQLTEVLNSLPKYDWKKMGIASRIRFEEEFTFQRMLNDYANIFDSFNI